MRFSLQIVSIIEVIIFISKANGENTRNLKVKFFLFTRDNLNEPIELLAENENRLNTDFFNPKNPTKIIIHGYFSNIHNEIFSLIKNAYLENGPHNIIGMDWSRLSNRDYISALVGLVSAAKILAKFIFWLQSHAYVRIDEMHLIGHSLGSHLAAVAASHIKTLAIGTQLYRITGLDPASPGFKDMPFHLRLDRGDARLVDVIHTSSTALAIDIPLGHLDFYPNGGLVQPGCTRIFQLRVSVTCNHSRSYWYFAESIQKPFGFATIRCDNYLDAIRENCSRPSSVFMGNPNTYKSGIYYLKTRSRSPFSNH